MKKVLAVIAGMVAGGIAMSIVQMISSLLHPMPANLSLSDTEGVREWISNLPASAFAIVLFSHSLGAYVAAVVCRLIVGEKWRRGTLIIAGLFTLAGIANSIIIPQPIWVSLVDVVVYFPAALLGESMIRNSKRDPVTDATI